MESEQRQASLTEEVIFCDTDCGGVVSNIAYLRFIEKARCLLFHQLGMPLAGMSRSGVFPTVVRTEIDYLKPARLGDRIRVVATVASIEKVRISCDFELTSDEAGPMRVFARATQRVVLVKMPEGKPLRPPEEWNF